jgi:histidine triad (HIT) family protein
MNPGVMQIWIRTEKLMQQAPGSCLRPNCFVAAHASAYPKSATRYNQPEMSSLFTKIRNREIPADIVYEDDHVFAFRDIDPVAPVHIVIATVEETTGLAAIPETGDHTHILNAARKIAEDLKLDGGYRLVINQGEDGGQSFNHLHAHLLGGRTLTWPPG